MEINVNGIQRVINVSDHVKSKANYEIYTATIDGEVFDVEVVELNAGCVVIPPDFLESDPLLFEDVTYYQLLELIKWKWRMNNEQAIKWCLAIYISDIASTYISK